MNKFMQLSMRNITHNLMSVSVAVLLSACGYVANYSSSNISNISHPVSQYTVGAGGALSPMAASSVPAGTSPVSVTVDPSGKYAYVVVMSAPI